MLAESELAVLLEKEIERLDKCALAGRAEQVCAQLRWVGVLTADDAQRLKHIAIDMRSWACKVDERRCEKKFDARGIVLHPRVGQNFRHLYSGGHISRRTCTTMATPCAP